MKVLIKKGGKVPADILTFGISSNGFVTLDGEPHVKGKGDAAKHAPGEVREVADNIVLAAINDGVRKQEFIRPKDVVRDIKWIAKAAANYEDGTEANIRPSSRGYSIDFDEDGRIERAANLAEGDLIAVGPNISPKAMMNARGLVAKIKADKCEIEFEDDDLDRIKRATGKNFTNPVTMPVSSMEKVA